MWLIFLFVLHKLTHDLR